MDHIDLSPVETGLHVSISEDGNLSITLNAQVNYKLGPTVEHVLELAEDNLPDGLADVLKKLLADHRDELLTKINKG